LQGRPLCLPNSPFSILHSPFSIPQAASTQGCTLGWYAAPRWGAGCNPAFSSTKCPKPRPGATLRVCSQPDSPRSSITCQATQGCTSSFSLLHSVLIRTLQFLHLSDCAQICYLLNNSLFLNTDEKCGLTVSGVAHPLFDIWPTRSSRRLPTCPFPSWSTQRKRMN
jgi:hypothetical protein